MPCEPATYINPRTGATWPLAEPLWRAPDDLGPVELTDGPGLTPADIARGEGSLWRYQSALRVPKRLSLGEGWTPLVPGRWNGRDVLFKCEHLQPSGSYKDRGIAVLVNALIAAGLTEILEDSSGNAGAAMATYCRAAGIACAIYAPAAAPAGKLMQMQAFGADLHRVPGSRQDTTDAALAAAETRFYASHAWQPFFVEGTKTLAFELWEQMGFRLPDHVVMPAGQGGNVLGLATGFAELVAAGQIARPPRLHAVQAEGCSPLVAAFEGREAPALAPTVADGIATPQPVRAAAILEAVRGSGGQTVAVSEDRIRAALRDLLAGGWYVEPTTAAGAAGLTRLQEAGHIQPGESAVLLLTGHGLKAGAAIAAALG
ncbi:MAG: pyridoxal-phosphate dependent enzyme [Alphaproteobacteria bacterium]|nr:pyridoxal-phosphate dependent enzyme [Alphaproteobacteria bacterium]MCB9928317.1 pyridoxal-phosphate dependent enzyme [Alphaproteobacteria bacterium]